MFRGDFVGGAFVAPSGDVCSSVNPAQHGEVVLALRHDLAHVDLACEAAAAAQVGWQALSSEQRWHALTRFRAQLSERVEEIGDAICRETGKLRAEGLGEARSLVARFDLVRAHVTQLQRDAERDRSPSAWMRWRPHGVVGVIGPFNYPLHLCHAHVLPALLLGNTVVIKPAESTALCAQLYAECARAAELPAGVLNLVHGGGAHGAALVQDSRVRGLCFTGSWHTGRAIAEVALERPELLVALEMGGKNPAIVLADADLRQAAHEIAVGAYLTTGQRCTCTERVLVDRRVAEELAAHLAQIVEGTRYGAPDAKGVFGGPMATLAGANRHRKLLLQANLAGAELLATGAAAEGPFYVPPTLHRAPAELAGYTDTELFGPDLALTVVDGLDQALSILADTRYGLAASVFTADEAAFGRVSQALHSGLLHHNRTTNQASGAMPFGGVGRSGNFRPAGSFAVRNVGYPMASMRNPVGGFVADPRLAALLPPPDLDALLRRHAEEEQLELSCDDRTMFPRPVTMGLPPGGRLPQSERWLERLYAGGRMSREKKPGVVDLGRSHGPWMCSVDDDPLCVMDAMSQTATAAAGFAPDEVVAAFYSGAFDGTIDASPDTAEGHASVEALAAELRCHVPGYLHVAFANSGAEANEKALALAAYHDTRGATKVLAFEGSFHGRTLLALHATWNPAKREPFTTPGFEVTFAPFPVAPGPLTDAQAPTPDGYLEVVAAADLATARARFAGLDLLLDAELAALEVVHVALSAQPHVAALVEPMQSEGGDRYATARFFRALRLLTRAHGVPLIFDEVQCGFGLSGTFAWHHRFELVRADGSPDQADAVTFAKRAQVGAVMSNWPDPEPTSSHAASLVRGRLHAQISADPAPAARVEAATRRLLTDLHRRFPELIGNPRCSGFALAFDLPKPALLSRWLGQRFWRGAVVFAAGQRTVRYRLSRAFSDADIEKLFETMRRTAAWITAHPGCAPPRWEDLPQPAPRATAELSFRLVGVDEAQRCLDAVMALEALVYEPARRDTRAHLAKAFEEGGVAVIAEDERGHIVGSCLGAPLEAFADVQGCDDDAQMGKRTTLYATATTVHPDYRGAGVGRRLKAAQMTHARRSYRFISGRNRVGAADAMTRIVRSLGGHIVARYGGQYGEASAEAVYYRIPLQPLTAAERAAITKLTICNYVTPSIVRAIEHCCALTPQLPHLYLTSCRDELVDKALRLFRWRRKAAGVAITFEGQYFGHTTAAARSLSDPAVHRMGAPWVQWPRLPHPADVGTDATMQVLQRTVQAIGAERVLCVAVEPLGERSGKRIPDDFWPALAALRGQLDVPVLAIDTAGAFYRGGKGPFSIALDTFAPDVLGWWTGGQTGLLHVAPRWFEAKPLTFVSTWDGDELSLIRAKAQLVAARATWLRSQR